MAQNTQQDDDEEYRYPIERGFPIERVNDIAAKEGSSKMHYRPTSMMHKWWARRLGCVFRAISLYTLVDDPDAISVEYPDADRDTLTDFAGETPELEELIGAVDLSDPESLWPLYTMDVEVEDKSVLDPFMGGGTTLMEASRFGADVTGVDLNPVAWFVTKKELEAGETDIDDLEAAYEQVSDAVEDELRSYYQRSCPNGHDHEADVMYEFWIRELDCISCGSTVPLFKDYRVAAGRYENKGRYHVYCPECNSVFMTDDARSESVCTECSHEFTPSKGPVSRGGYYTCQDCGLKYSITDAIEEGQTYDERLYALEYHCRTCDDDENHADAEAKSYIAPTEEDFNRFESAVDEWEDRSEDLREFLPQTDIPEGAITTASSISGNDVFQHGYETWDDMFNTRQQLALTRLLEAIEDIEDQNIKEYLLLAFSDSLMFHNNFTIYNRSGNKIEGVFKTNSFNPQMEHIENNVWGCDYGRGTFEATWEKVLRGVRWAAAPTERFIDEDGDTAETGEFHTPVGGSDYTLHQGDMRTVDLEESYDAVITDPPYYDNIIYNEVANFFYVWQRQLLASEYEEFEYELTPDLESIATNPSLGKDDEDFESDLAQAFTRIHDVLDEDGVLAFTYHHKGSESWGELLEALCEVGFEVTAAYPVSADLTKFIQGDAVSFDIIVVARPADTRTPISWRELKRDIYKTARRTRRDLQANRTLSQGDIGVMEMGVCFHEYSKHHGKVRRGDGVMNAKEVVEEIYGIIQDASDVGVVDVFIDLLETSDPTFDDVMKLCRGTSADVDELREMRLFNTEDGFELGTWDNEQRQAYIQDKLSKDPETLTDLDRLQFLRNEFDRGSRLQEYTTNWDIGTDMIDLAERLAEATNDDVYRRLLGDTQL